MGCRRREFNFDKTPKGRPTHKVCDNHSRVFFFWTQIRLGGEFELEGQKGTFSREQTSQIAQRCSNASGGPARALLLQCSDCN